jgi:hypothetical protein
VKEADVALELIPLNECKVTGVPSWVPSAHTAGDDVGPHSKNVTEPVGAPPAALPVTVATSVTDPPSAIDPEPDEDVDCCVVVVDGPEVTLKHSLSLCCHTDE